MIHSFRNQESQEMISFPKILTKLDIQRLSRPCGWWRCEPEKMRNYSSVLAQFPVSCTHLETLLSSVAPVAVLTAEWFLSVGFVTAGENV